MSAAANRAAFAAQAEWCRRLEAPFTARLLEALGAVLADTSQTGRSALGWPGDPMRDAVALRLTGGLHAMVRAGQVPGLATLYPPAPLAEPAALEREIAAILADPARDAQLHGWLAGPPQTNEVGRSAVLMPGLMAITALTHLPLRLFELGASAGLNLCLDRWHYDLGGLATGDPASAVRLAPRWCGAPPPAVSPRIVARHGVDLAPLDVGDPATAARLVAYVWPDQPARVARAAAAIAAAAADPPLVDRAEGADWVEARVAPVQGTTTVVLHSIALQYFPAKSRARIAAHLAAQAAFATPEAPLAWLSYELEASAPGSLAAVRLTLWRGGEPETHHLADAHPHGSRIDWRSAPSAFGPL